MIKKSLKIILTIILVLIFLYLIIAYKKIPEKINYGASFNTLYAKELGLDWRDVYDAMIDDLGIKKIRLAAHWDLIEPLNNEYTFSEIDYQVQKAKDNNVDLIFAVGKRLPRWPECHIPDWAKDLSEEEEQEEILEYIEVVINRYKDYENIQVWQVENEPFLSVFAKEHCRYFDKDFLEKEIKLVQDIDPTRKILVTDSGELSTWRKSYGVGDIFGTTLYVYAWNSVMGEFRNFVLPGFYSARKNIWNLFYGEREAIIAELALEPWLDKAVIKESTDIQIRRMSPDKFEKVLEFAQKTGFEIQYLWGVEWWYYMRLQGESWYWDKGKELFNSLE